MAMHRIAMEEESHDQTPNKQQKEDEPAAAPVGIVIRIKPIHVTRLIGVLLETAIHCLKAIQMAIQSPTILDPPPAEIVEQPQEDPKHKLSTPPPPSTNKENKESEHLEQEQTTPPEQQIDPLQVDWKAVEQSIQEAVDSVDWNEVGDSIQTAAEKVDWKQVGRTLEDWAQSVDWKSVGTSLCDAFDRSSPSEEQSKHTE
jgi:hypothetical protein